VLQNGVSLPEHGRLFHPRGESGRRLAIHLLDLRRSCGARAVAARGPDGL